MTIEVVREHSVCVGARATKTDSRQSGNLCACCDGNPGNQYLPALAAGHRGRSARLQRGGHLDHHGLSGDFRRRTIDCRPGVGPVRAANADPDRALHFRGWNDLVRCGKRSVEPADRPIDAGVRRLCSFGAFTRCCPGSVRWPGACKGDGVDHDGNRGRPGLLATAGQCARSSLRLALGIRLCRGFRALHRR